MDREFDRRRLLPITPRVPKISRNSHVVRPSVIVRPLEEFKLDFLQCVAGRGRTAQSLDAGYGMVYDTSDLGGEIGRAFLAQTLLGLLGRKPTRITPSLFRRIAPQHLTEMGLCRDRRRVGILAAAFFAAKIARKRSLLNPAMNPGFLKCFYRGGLSVRQARLGTTFGKSPAPAAASLHQQEFDALSTDPIADRRHLHAFSESAQLQETNRPIRATRPVTGKQRLSNTHRIRVLELSSFRLEPILVRARWSMRYTTTTNMDGGDAHAKTAGIFLHTCAAVRRGDSISFSFKPLPERDFWNIFSVFAVTANSKPDTSPWRCICLPRRWGFDRAKNLRPSGFVSAHNAPSLWRWDLPPRARSTWPHGR